MGSVLPGSSRSLFILLSIFSLGNVLQCVVSLSSPPPAAKKKYDVIVIGGSTAGLSAALSLGRSRRNVLVIDSGKPCNRFQEKSHNLLGSDGKSPVSIREQSLADVSAYPTVDFLQGSASQVWVDNDSASISVGIATECGNDDVTISQCRKLLIATGVQDLLPEMPGLKDCWGKTVIHCPYCHGYEFSNLRTALAQMTVSTVLTMAPIISKFTNNLCVIGRYEDGQFDRKQLDLFEKHDITLINQDATSIRHEGGILSSVVLESGDEISMDCVYLRPPFEHRIPLDQLLSLVNIESDLLDERGYIQVDTETQKTCIPNIYACGDCTDPNRSLSIALASGTRAAKMMNYELAIEDWSIL